MARQASSDTGLGLRSATTELSIGTVAPRLFIAAHEQDASIEFDLLRVDGLAECWHPERQRMVPMVYCVWAHPYTGQTPWQPLECVSSLSIIEFMRRNSLGCAWLERMISEESHEEDQSWVKNPPGKKDDDEAITPYPGSSDYQQGEVPPRPEVPTRVFTDVEVKTADATARRWAAFSRQSVPTTTAAQVEKQAVEKCSSQNVVINNHGTLHLTCTPQMLQEGGITVGQDSVVQASSVSRHDVSAVGDHTVVFYGDNNSYRPELPPQ